MQNPAIRILDSHEALFAAAADLVVRLGREALARHGRFLIALAGGSTPLPLYETLARPPHCAEPFWQHTHFFWGDERLVPPDDPGSNFGQARAVFLNPVGALTEHIHHVRGDYAPSEAVVDYCAQLAAYAAKGLFWPRFDLVLLGMGRDGHIASLFPADDVPAYDQPALVVTARDRKSVV